MTNGFPAPPNTRNIIYIEFRQAPVAETRDLDENTQVDFDERGGICAMTLEHASERADLPALDYEQVAA